MAFVPYTDQTVLATGTIAVAPSCSEIPGRVTDSANRRYVLDVETAANLDIALPLSVRAHSDFSRRVFVREVSKFAKCDSKDGNSALYYGAVWRATAMIHEEHALGEISFAVVAASATLTNSSVTVEVQNRGFSDPAVDEAGQEVMRAAQGGLNVESFSRFNDAVEKAIDLVMRSPVGTPLRLIGVTPLREDDIEVAIARTFALSYLAESKTVDAAIQDLPAGSQAAQEAIRDTFRRMKQHVPREDPELIRLMAAHLLGDRRLRRRAFWH